MIAFKLLLLLLLANGAPILARILFGKRFEIPLDGGRTTGRGRPWLGPSKTLRGLLAAVLITALAAVLLGFTWEFGCLIGLLAMTGDLLASFIKRRLGLASSSRAIGLDQIPESLLPALYSHWQLGLSWAGVAALVAIFWLCDILLSRLFYHWGIRRHPY